MRLHITNTSNALIKVPLGALHIGETAIYDITYARFNAISGDLDALVGAGSIFYGFTQLSVIDFGAVGNGTNDDTAAINAAIQFAKAHVIDFESLGCKILMPKGSYLVSDTLLINEAVGISLIGDGVSSTVIQTTGMVGKTVIQLRNASFCVVEGFLGLGDHTSIPSTFIEMRHDTGFAGFVSTKCVVRDVQLGGDDLTTYGRGIAIGGNDANNDFHTFERVHSFSHLVAAAAIEKTQAVGQSFLNCNFNGVASGGARGVWVGATPFRGGDTGNLGGKFNWRGGSCGGHTVADFVVSGEGPGVNSIDDCNSEGSFRFLDSSFLPGVTSNIVINNVRYSSDSSQSSDNKAFKWQFNGNFEMTNCRFDQSDVTKFAGISLVGIAPLTATITGNFWNQAGADVLNLITKSNITPTSGYLGGQYFTIESNLFQPASAPGPIWKGNTVDQGLSVKDTGAKGDGTTDDTSAWQRAIDLTNAMSLKTLFVPAGQYVIRNSLNCTGLTNGFSIKANPGVIAQVKINCTDRALFDLTGSAFCRIENLWLEGDASNTPAAAILVARDFTNGSAGEHIFTNLVVRGSFKLAPVVSISSESNTWNQCDIPNDYAGGHGFYLTDQNASGIISDYATFPTTWTGGNTVTHFFGGRIGVNGNTNTEHGLIVSNARDVGLFGTFMDGNGGDSCVYFLGDCSQFNWTGGSAESQNMNRGTIVIKSGVTVSNSDFSISAVNPFYGEDTSKLIHSAIRGEFYGHSTYGIDLSIIENCVIACGAFSARARSQALCNTFVGFGATDAPNAGSGNATTLVVLPSGDNSRGNTFPTDIEGSDGRRRTIVHVSDTGLYSEMSANWTSANLIKTRVQIAKATDYPSGYQANLTIGGAYFDITLDDNLTLLDLNAAGPFGFHGTKDEGARLGMVIRQDSTGGRNILAWPTGLFGITGIKVKQGPLQASYFEWQLDPDSNWQLTNIDAIDLSEPINVKDFGALGDGTTNDAVAIQRAIAMCTAHGGGTIWFPTGTYIVNSSLVMPQYVTLEGADRASTLLTFNVGASTDAVTFISPNLGVDYGHGGGLKNVTLNSTATSHVRDLLLLQSWESPTMENVDISGAGRDGLRILDGINTYFNRCRFRNSHTAGVYIDTAGASVTTSVAFDSCYFTGTTDGPGADIAGLGLVFLNCIFESNGSNTGSVGHGVQVRSKNAGFYSPYFENNAGHDLNIGSSANADVVVTNPVTQTGGLTDATKAFAFVDNALSGSFVGGNISARGHTIVLTGNNTGLSITGVETGSNPPEYTAMGKTILDYPGFIQYQDPSSGFYRYAGNVQQMVPIAGTVWNDGTSQLLKLSTSVGLEVGSPLTVGAGKSSILKGNVALVTGTPYATATLPAAELALNNGTVDAPGIHFYTGTNENMAIDATHAGGLRFLKDAEEGTGASVGSLNRSGDLALNGAFSCANNGNPFSINGVTGKVTSPFTDTSGSPGSATIGTPTGRAAIASGASSCTITSSVCLAGSRVQVQLETAGAGIANLVVVPSAGSFLVSSVNGTGVVVVTIANTKFSFTVEN